MNRKKNPFKLLFKIVQVTFLIAFIVPKDLNVSFDILTAIVIFLGLFVFFHLSIAFHELGHLIFGLASGYKFLSFRYLSFMIQKDQNQRLRFKKYSVVGTGGQCLMIPPKKDPLPIFLYNAGGVIMNVFLAIILALTYLLDFNGYLNTFLLTGAVLNLFFAYLNWGKFKRIQNDGKNYYEAKKQPLSRKSFEMILVLNHELAFNKPFSDIKINPAYEALSFEHPLQSQIKVTHAVKSLYELRIEDFIEKIEEYEAYFQSINIKSLTHNHVYVYFSKLLKNELNHPILKNTQLINTFKVMKYEPLFVLIKYYEALLFKKDSITTDRIGVLKAIENAPLAGEKQDLLRLLEHLESFIDFKTLTLIP
ncbi:MAG: hypothetical protein RBQ91_05245 [Acholeplasma sp.]|nr:hypothetical protein [Acholeplasma sp.]